MKKYLPSFLRNEKDKQEHQVISDDIHSEIIASKGYIYVETIKEQQEKQSYKIKKDGQNYIIKFTSRFNDTFTRIYSDFLRTINCEFQRLIIPECVEYDKVDNEENYVILKWIEGKNFRDRWSSLASKTEGGLKIKDYTISLILELIEDLIKIDTDYLVGNNFRTITPEVADQILTRQINKAREESILSDKQHNSAKQIQDSFLAKINHRDYMLSNGDFQFLNFIEISDQKTALIDWDGARISCFEKEHCVALQWLLMWNNAAWRASFLDRVVPGLNLDKDIFRGALLMLILKLNSESGFGESFFKASTACLYKILNHDDYNSIWQGS